MRVAVIGTGYVGLVTGTCLASLGNDVVCVDVDEAKVKKLQGGAVTIYEPGLEEVFAGAIKAGKLHFTASLAEGVKGAEAIFLALPTPPGEDGSADLSYVLGVADQLGPLLTDYAVVIDKSTVPVGTAEKVQERIAKNAKVAFDVVSNPEFLREGVAVGDFMQPDRIVIGAPNERSQAVMAKLYEPIIAKGSKVLYVSPRSAELTKYASNSFLALKITYINQIANLCELVCADVEEVRQGVGSDPRIGERFLYPGIGYGGSCFPKDVQALVHTAKEYGYDFNLIASVIDLNMQQQERLLAKALAYYGDLKGKTFALWGLAFKPDTDDIRESPAMRLLKSLLAAGAHVQAYDPEAMEPAKAQVGTGANVTFAADALSALSGADALLVATEYPEFAQISIDDIKKRLKTPTVFDGRNLFPTEVMQKAGFHYESIGRATVN